MNWFDTLSFSMVGPKQALEPLAQRWVGSGVTFCVGSGEVIADSLVEHYPASKLRRLDLYSKTALLAAHNAMRSAGPTVPGCGLMVCTGFGPVPAINTFIDSFLEFGPQGASPTAFAQTVHNLAASTISIFLGMDGPILTVSQPETGVSSALFTAKCWMDEGRVDAVLFGVVDDAQTFTRILAGNQYPSEHGTTPSAAFMVLSRNATDGGCLFSVCEVTPGIERQARMLTATGPGPMDVVTSFLAALEPGTAGEYLAVCDPSPHYSRHIVLGPPNKVIKS